MRRSDVDWKLVCQELGMFHEDPEGTIHEIVHAYDCKGHDAFWHVGKQNEVSRLIDEKYDGDDSWEANRAEVKVAATTDRVAWVLGFWDESWRKMVQDALLDNMRGDWFDQHTKEDTLLMFEDDLTTPWVASTSETVAAFLQENFVNVDFGDGESPAGE